MRKFTLFLALMVTMVTTAFAQGSEVIDIASNADAMLYSNAPCKVTTWGDDFKGWDVLFDNNASTIFHSDYSGDDSVDGLDHYLRVDMGEGNSVSLFTFTFTTRNTNCEVNSPTTIVVEGSNEADGEYTEIATLTGLPITNSTVYTSETLGSEDVAYRYIRYRVTATKTNQKQGGHVFFFISEFGMSKVKAGAVLANIKYTYTYNGETIGSAAATAFVGDAYPEPTNVPFGYFAETPAGAVEGNEDVTIECTLKLPFEYAETADAITTWYYMQMHSNNKRYIQYVEGENSIEWLDAEVAEGEENSYIWAFVGTPATGFKLVNYAATVEKALCGNGEGNPAMGAFADGVNWTPAASDVPGADFFCLQFPGGNYMNAQNGKVAYWNDNDAGSTIILTTANPVVEPTVEPLEITGYTPAEAVESLNEITVTFNDEIAGEQDLMSMNPVYVGSQRNAANWVVEGNTIKITLWSPITTPGEYGLVIPKGHITRKANGEDIILDKEIVFTVKEATKPLEITGYTPAEAVESLNEITVTFNDEIAGEQDLMSMNPVYVGSQRNAANWVVEGNTIKITLWSPITTPGEYGLVIPKGHITRKANGEDIILDKEIVFTVKEATKPLEITGYTPAEAVESLNEITVTFNDEIAGEQDLMSMNPVYVGSQRNAANWVVEGNTIKITLWSPITTPGEYGLVIPKGHITRKANGEDIILDKEIVFTVKEASAEPVALEAVSTERNPLETAINGQYKLQGVKINFGEVVKKYTTDLNGDYGYILDAEGNEVAKLNRCMGGNGSSNTFATPYASTAIETPGTYKVVVKAGVILSADGTKEYKGGEFEFTVAERAVEVSPSAEEGFCWNETYENINDFKEQVITVKYAKSDVVINNDVKATMKTGETVYEATVTVEKSGNTQYITLAFDGEFAEGRYAINVPAGLFTVDGVANEAYAQSTFTYRKPQLEITRDFDTWESYLDQVWYMPTAAMITIANAESVEVDDTKVATIALGETVYTSTLNWYYDDWSNAYYIEYQFEDFYAEGFEFAKGDYTFTLPAGAYTVNGVANEEAVKTYTYGDPIVEEFSITEILPAAGSVLESIDAISITFSNGMAADVLPVTCGEKTYYFVSMSGVYVPVDMMSYEPIVITEPGTYTLDLSELEGLTGEKVFSWTIPAPAPTLNETVVFDFASNVWEIPGYDMVNFRGVKTVETYTDGVNNITIDPTKNKGEFYYENGCLRLAKPGSKIILPAFDFAVEKIEVVGHSAGSSYQNVDMNVYVGDAAVSTACIGTTETYTYEIAADNQAAGNVYELVIGSNGGNYSSVMFITYIKVYPAENKLEAPEFNLESGVYVGEQTVNVHSATTELEGVTDVTYYYTTDGNEPTVEDEETDGAITITESCTLKVIVEFTYGDKVYVSASSSAEYIITEEVTYHRATSVESGSYFIVADGNMAAPIEGTSLPTVEVAVEGNDVTAPAYYTVTLEKTAGGYYIKDVNGNYIYNTMMNPNKLYSNTSAPMDAWTITIAKDENSTATIMCNGYALAFNNGVFCTVSLGGTDVPVMPTLYGTYATGINEAVVNGEAIESIYDLQGRKVEKVTKGGIYIVNGKKVLVK